MSEKSNSDPCNRYYYAYLTEEREIGESSKHTPQHITLFPPFVAYQSDAFDIAKDVASQFDSINVELGNHAMFGPEGDISVVLIKPNETLSLVHMALIKEIEQRKISIPSNHYIGEFYVPHIALKSYHPELDETKLITIDNIAVMRKCKEVKTVMAKYALSRAQ